MVNTCGVNQYAKANLTRFWALESSRLSLPRAHLTTGQYIGILGDFSHYWIADAMNMTGPH